MIKLTKINNNFYEVIVGDNTFFFSYETCIAIEDNNGLHICENVWSKTTGKHLNMLQKNKNQRYKWDQFQKLLNKYNVPKF